VPRSQLTHVEVYLFRRTPRAGLLLLRRAKRDSLPGIWQPVTGRIEPGERALDAAVREVREETGLDPTRWWRLEHVVSYIHPKSDELRVVALFAAEMNGRPRVTLSHEHDALRWVTLAAAAPMVLWDTQRFALQALRHQVLGSARIAAALEIELPPAKRMASTSRRARTASTSRRRRTTSTSRRARG